MIRVGRTASLAGIVLLIASAVAGAFSTPERTGWVTDAAHVLDADAAASLASQLEELQRKTGDEVVVVTLPDLQGTTIENWGNVLGDSWKIGKVNGREDGVLLIVAPNDRRVRIAVGHGLASRISDSIAANIISDHILPYLRNGDMPQGIRAGIDSIALQLDTGAAANSVEVSPYSAPPPSLWSRLHYALTPSRHTMVISFWVLVAIVVLIFMVLNAGNVGSGGRRRSGWYDDDYYGSRSHSSGSSWGGGGSSGGSSGGGGGGSFGGGASGSW